MRSIAGRVVRTHAVALLAAGVAAQVPQATAEAPDAAALVKAMHEYTLRTATWSCSYRQERAEIRIRDVGSSDMAELVALLEEIARTTPDSATDAAIRDKVQRVLAVPSPDQGPQVLPADTRLAPPELTVIKRTMSVVHVGDLEIAKAIDPTADLAAVITGNAGRLTWLRSNDQVNYAPDHKPSRSDFGIPRMLAPLPADDAAVRMSSSLEWRSATDEQARITLLTGTGKNHKREVWLDRRGLPVRTEVWSGPPEKTVRRELGLFAHAAIDGSREVVDPGASKQRPDAATFVVASVHFLWSRSQLTVECSRLSDISFAAPAKEEMAVTVPATIKILVTRVGQPDQMLHAGNQASWPDFLEEHLRIQR